MRLMAQNACGGQCTLALITCLNLSFNFSHFSSNKNCKLLKACQYIILIEYTFAKVIGNQKKRKGEKIMCLR